MSERAEIRFLQAAAVLFVAIKLVYIFTVGPIADEAYYWMWGRNPGLSYFDHPPFQAWMLGLAHLVLGRSLFALRVLTLLCLLGTLAIFRVWANRYGGDDAERIFWRSVVAYLGSTTLGFFTSLAMHDYMLAFLLLLAGHFFLTFLVAVREGERGKLRYLYLGAIVLGLAGLTKYNAVFLGLGLAAYIVTERRLRGLLLSPHLYVAGAISIAMQTPVLIWNIKHDFASFGFHLGSRHPEGWLTRINWWTIGDFVVISLLMVSPFLVPAFVRFLLSRPAAPFEAAGKGLASWVFWLSSLFFLALSAFDMVYWWWNVAAYVLLIPLAARYMGRWLMAGHVVLGAIMAGYLLTTSLISGPKASIFGWNQFEAPIRAAELEHKTAFVAAYTPELASTLGFALDDPTVTAFHPWVNQFDFWWNAEAHRGQDAILVLRSNEPDAVMDGQFESVTPLGDVMIRSVTGDESERFRLYLGHNYLAPASDQQL